MTYILEVRIVGRIMNLKSNCHTTPTVNDKLHTFSILMSSKYLGKNLNVNS